MTGFMRLRGRNCGPSVAAKSFAVALMVASTLAQFFALSHEVTVRHFRCAEHGEMTHVAALPVDLPAPPPPGLTDTFRSSDADTVDGHEHCSSAFTVERASFAPVVRVPVRNRPPVVSQAVLLAVPRSGRAFVLASAPKTSPPSA